MQQQVGVLAVWVGQIHPCRLRHPQAIPLVDGDDPHRVIRVGGRATQQQGVVRLPGPDSPMGGEPGLELPHARQADRALQPLAKGKELPPMRNA